ncbi:hypothetical protein [Enterococcus hirae]|uniref:hypothetical protein n=1 Tax=Enterococcus hirae TaxID=1354 RepID=UPI002DBBAB76|nr:hypothetical protein [Enterococcus hirae]MEB5880129.1 hypothetical protein [Enterococcus hirae]MEB5907184.1 hypothetical protein [Enterococcus hirae]
MINNILKVNECLEILRKFGINMSEPAFRQAIRKGHIKNTFSNSKKEGINIPLAALMNFMISKLSGNHDAFELGKFYNDQMYLSQPLPVGGFGEIRSYLAKTLFNSEYIYLIQSGMSGTYASYRLYIDYKNYTIHLYDDSNLEGISSINLISDFLILDIWRKLNENIDDEILEKTCVNIYYKSASFYSEIRGFCVNKTNSFCEPRYPLYERFEKQIKESVDFE